MWRMVASFMLEVCFGGSVAIGALLLSRWASAYVGDLVAIVAVLPGAIIVGSALVAHLYYPAWRKGLWRQG